MITELLTMRGYPMFLNEIKNDVLNVVSDREVNIGDGFVFGSHLLNYDRKMAIINRVTEVIETRPAKGNHDREAFYYKLKVNKCIEDISEELVSNSNTK